MTTRRHAFILRIWVSTDANKLDAGPTLRGSLQQPGSQNVLYFNSFVQLITLVKQEILWEDASGQGIDPMLD